MSIEERLERIEAILDARGLDWDHPRVDEDHFVDASKMVAEEPAKKPEPEHLAGPMPDPGKGYRILSKDPLEDLQPGDEFKDVNGKWIRSENAETTKKQGETCWYRRKIGFPAREPEPAWEPKVGDWVRVTRPSDWEEWKDPLWREEMHIYDGKVFELVKCSQWSTGQRASLQGIDWFFHRDWLTPAEPPAIDKPPEPEYREPVLPADADKKCEFSDDGQSWLSGWVYGWVPGRNWVTLNNNSWKHARIKKDA